MVDVSAGDEFFDELRVGVGFMGGCAGADGGADSGGGVDGVFGAVEFLLLADREFASVEPDPAERAGRGRAGF